ncbi:MAG: protein-tyrosine-phosphatase, partial [Rhizobium oryzihabitans]
MSDPAAAPNEGRAPKSVLFMCGMNSIRSPMAEVIAKRLVAPGIYIQSAG